MANRNPAVDEYLANLDHPDLAGIAYLREKILQSDDRITESIKWNAPNFRFDGEDRVTFRLKPGNRFQLIFHRGAKTREDGDSVAFDDETGLIEWATPDRGVLTIEDAADAEERQSEIVALINRWMAAAA